MYDGLCKHIFRMGLFNSVLQYLMIIKTIESQAQVAKSRQQHLSRKKGCKIYWLLQNRMDDESTSGCAGCSRSYTFVEIIRTVLIWCNYFFSGGLIFFLKRIGRKEKNKIPNEDKK